MNQWPGKCPLNEADCAFFVRMLTQDGPLTAQEAACCEEVNLPLPEVVQRNDALMAQARLLLEKFFPQRMPTFGGNTPSGMQ